MSDSYSVAWLQNTEQVNRDASFTSYDTPLNTDNQLDELAPWWRNLSTSQQTGLLELVAIFGVNGLFEVDRFMYNMQKGSYTSAVNDLKRTTWYSTKQLTNGTNKYNDQLVPKVTINPAAQPILDLLVLAVASPSRVLMENSGYLLTEQGFRFLTESQ